LIADLKEKSGAEAPQFFFAKIYVFLRLFALSLL